MIGIVIVSHSKKAAEGICELAMQMADPQLRILTAAGMPDGSLGRPLALTGSPLPGVRRGRGASTNPAIRYESSVRDPFACSGAWPASRSSPWPRASACRRNFPAPRPHPWPSGSSGGWPPLP